jgi:hypothetical protein
MRKIGYFAFSTVVLSVSLAGNAWAGDRPSLMQSSLSTAATAVQIAQAAGECRLVNRQMGIYQEPRTDSASLGLIQDGDVVVLGTGSDSGWARIVQPTVGWVDARNLRVIRCPSGLVRPQPDPIDPMPDHECAVVIYPGIEGLAIYDRPSSNSPPIGTLPERSRMELTGRRIGDRQGRQWVEIRSSNGLGWVAETGPTGPDSGYNIRRLQCSSIVGDNHLLNVSSTKG